MIVTYKFNSENPDDMHDLKIFQQSSNMYRALWEISHCRKKFIWIIDEKIEKGELDSKAYEVLDMVLEKIHEVISEYEVNLE